MTDPIMTVIDDFMRRWEVSGAAERANYALFLTELCDILEVARPDPTRPDDAENAYVLERSVTFHNGDGTTSVGRIDLYKRGCFVLEAKQGSERPEVVGGLAFPKRTRRRGTAVRGTAGWDDAMLAAKGQAEQYVKALPASEPNPPFLVVVDVGHTIELYADFTRQGRTYVAFPDALTHRIRLRDLAETGVRERLRMVWTDPVGLDPSRRAASVTRDVAARLAKLAQLLEKSGHSAEVVAQFLMRCLFTFFAEDAKLLPKGAFTALLKSLKKRGEASLFPEMVRSLWETMRTGGFSPILRAQVLRFNGGLFESPEVLPITNDQLDLLIEAGEREWHDVEPAIFGTLLERALDPIERHKLGAHYTPRAYVERLVLPTIIEPLREDWANVQAAAVTLANEGKLLEARDEVRGFLRKLCNTIILDPACGTGNFLYVTLEHMKRLEGEVLDALKGFGETQAAFEGFGLTVDPHQLRGIEINPRAAAIADLVLWIGYLQWHFRTYGNRMPAEPIIHAYHNIDCRDAVLAAECTKPRLDDESQPVTRWDGRTTRPHPVSGEPVPDITARVPVLHYVNPRKAEWPQADFIIGNPPFIGQGERMRDALGDGYVHALRKAHPDVGDSSDYVMYWWNQAAHLVRQRMLRRFGLITTNSIRQPLNRRVIETHLSAKNSLFLRYAIPDHPWVDSANGADVRIAATVAETGHGEGVLQRVVSETPQRQGEFVVSFTTQTGLIHADLRIGANVAIAATLASNLNISNHGVIAGGKGFLVTREEAVKLGYGSLPGIGEILRPTLNGRDLTASTRGLLVIDLFGLSAEEVRDKFPEIYQWILVRVKPQRDENKRVSRKEKWWLFNENVPKLRNMLKGLSRFISTVETAKHRVFVFLESSILPQHKLINIATEDAFVLGVLSSRIHETWALAAGSWLGVGNDPVYVKSASFEKFPFPAANEFERTRIRKLAEALDAHRKRQLVEHPRLTLTDIYNVLVKLRSNSTLNATEQVVHDQGLVSILYSVHCDLDAAVFDAYGWPHNLTDEEILSRLVDLNRERVAEEARGIVRWLRPEFQNPEGTKDATQTSLPIEVEPEAPAKPVAPAKKQAWPKSLAEQAQAVRAVLSTSPGGLTPEQLARTFQRARVDRVSDLLETLVSLGQAREVSGGRYVQA